MQLPFLIEQNSHSDNLAGFRLQRVEVFNWGTFDRRVWVLNLSGKTALLTGANGSGKSTLVDALLTLLVPNRKRNYNQASSTKDKKDRDEKSYVQGEYKEIEAEESNSSKQKLLRKEGTITVLLAYFLNRVNQQKVTLAQVLWMEEGSVRKFFAIATDELSIVSHFTQCTRIADLKKALKTSGVEIFDEFIKYSQRFRKLFGLQSEKALDLFNQTVSIKEIGGLNDFVRNHMLEKTDVQTKISELLKNYGDLTISHEAIEKDRKQLELLIPLVEEAKKFSQIKQDLETLQSLKNIAPAYFAQKKSALLVEELRTIEQKLTQTQHQQEECDRYLANFRQKEQQLAIAIDNDRMGQRLQELKREIERQQKEVKDKKHQAEKYDRLAKLLNLPQYTDSDTFYVARTRGDALKAEIEQILQDLKTQRDEQITQRQDWKRQQAGLTDELASLRQRNSQIPKDNLTIRDSLVRALNLDETDLPFAGELLQIRPEAKEWEAAIERLLRNFGLSILVRKQHYHIVNSYVNNNNLKGYLVYYQVKPSSPNPTQRLEPQRVPHQLEIKNDNPEFYHWLREQLINRFNYICCDTLEQFQHETQAITRNGLIKNRGERHEKDDRFSIQDRSRYILGWNNADKIQVLEIELGKVNQQSTNVEQQIKSLDDRSKQQDEQISLLQNFMNFTDFLEIDWRTAELERQNLERQRQELEASSNELKQLETQLKKVKEEISNTTQQRDNLIREINTLESCRKTAKNKQCECKAKIGQFSVQQLEEFKTWVVGKLKGHLLTLGTIDSIETKIRDSLLEEVERGRNKQDSSTNAILKRMLNFSKEFPEETAEMGTSLEALEEYRSLKAKIEHDDLPRHERRFKELMTEKVISAISIFKSSLETTEEEIQQNIDELNESLQRIDYTESTYIKLCYKTTYDRQIRDFKNDLKTCLGNVAQYSKEDNERRFQNIQKLLIERFKGQEQERWTNKVTDVRNWLDFSVSECYRADDTQKEHYTDSSGKSGGQKTKLAYTILASAIAYQFGLHQENSRSESFRFVVIDEAFSKLDGDNARYAMELFKNLNLQLLVVTPNEKINVIESYLSSLHLVSINSEKDYSSITSISIEEYQQNRQSALNKDKPYD